MNQSYRIVLAVVIACCTVFTITVWTSCRKDLCQSTTCLHGGVCSNGSCKCPDGYQGEGCELSAFKGSWAGLLCEDQSGTDIKETLTITPSDSEGYFAITYEGLKTIYGKQTGNSLYIEKQALIPAGSSGGYTVRYVDGSMSSTRDTLTYDFLYQENNNYHYLHNNPPIYYKCTGKYMRN